MNVFASPKRLKYSAKRHLSGNYHAAVGATVTVQLISSTVSVLAGSISDRSTIYGAVLFYAIEFLIILLMALFSSGKCYLFLNMCCGRPTASSMVFYGCRNQPEKAMLIQLYQMLTYFILMVPGLLVFVLASATGQKLFFAAAVLLLAAAAFMIIYCAASFSQSFYLLHDFPACSARELVEMSCRIMRGHKLRYLGLYISFIPMYLAGFLSLGIGFLWVQPYVNTATTEFFLDLMNHKA